ncbi:golvesin C-terminal-like domain-containing protein [Streptomyces fungicidicus]
MPRVVETTAATAHPYGLPHQALRHDHRTGGHQGPNGRPRTWVSLGSYALQHGEETELKRERNSTGIVVADAVKLVRDQLRRRVSGRFLLSSVVSRSPYVSPHRQVEQADRARR